MTVIEQELEITAKMMVAEGKGILAIDESTPTIKKRFDTYSRQTLPVLEYYSKQEILHKVDGNRQIDQINEEIRGIIASLEA